HRTAIEQHGATSAFPQLAAMFGAGQPQVFAKDFQKGLMRCKRDLDRLAIHPQGDMRLRQLGLAFFPGWFHSLAVGFTRSDLIPDLTGILPPLPTSGLQTGTALVAPSVTQKIRCKSV